MTEYSRLPLRVIRTLEHYDVKFDIVTGLISDEEVCSTSRVKYIIRGDFEPLFFEDGQYAGYLGDDQVVISDDKRAAREHFIDAADALRDDDS